MLKLHTRQIDKTDTTMQRANKRTTKRRPKQNRRLGMASSEITGGGGWVWGLQLVSGRPTLAPSSALVPQTLNCLVCVEDSLLINALS